MELIYLASWIGATIVAQKIGNGKGRTNCWAWGLLLGWIGVLIVRFGLKHKPVTV